MKKVKDYYNRHVNEEDRRLDNNPFEIPVTLKYIEKYISPGDTVLDVACGTGRYAELLLNRGYRLFLNDLSGKNMERARQRTKGKPGLLGTLVSDALRSSVWEKHDWDAILVLGPLYHLPAKEDRLALLRKAAASVQSGGYLYLAFMSRTAAMLYGLKNNPSGIEREDGVVKLWETGTDKSFVEGTEWFTNAHFTFPEEVPSLLRESGLEMLHLVGIEGIFGENMELFHNLSRPLQKKWMNFVMDHGEDMHMVQYSKHLLCVCRPA
ncbi:MAG: class I SAM-dependent methyltransferase [Bacteroidales bacterium]